MSDKPRYRIVSEGSIVMLEIELNRVCKDGYDIKYVVARGETPGHIVLIMELRDAVA